MKKTTILVVLLACISQLSAKEGMWPPFLLKNIQKDLKAAGLQLSIDDLYDEQKASLKDAVVIFGGGCTGEVISSEGLVLTNHHCGYGTVQGLSDVDKNYLIDGFFAMNRKEEIPCPGLVVKFIESYQDITTQILAETNLISDPEVKDSIIRKNTKAILDEKRADSTYLYVVSDFFQGNQFFLIKYKVYKDVRLVAFPPNGIGKFGGDTDNWAWPRHTGDFGLFRVYAGADNEPADYDPSNQPYQPKKYLTINVDGAQPGAYTMVYGFPGRTSEYISSHEMSIIKDLIDPARIQCREVKLNVWNKAMAESEEVFVKYARKQASVANYWKKWKGEVQGLEMNNVLDIKKGREKTLMKTLGVSQIAELDSLRSLMSRSGEFLTAYYYYIEALRGVELYSVASSLRRIPESLEKGLDMDSVLTKVRASLDPFYKNYVLDIDRQTSKNLLRLYKKDVPAGWQLPLLKSTTDIDSYLDEIYQKSALTSLASAQALLDQYEKSKNIELITSDEMYRLGAAIHDYYEQTLKPALQSYSSRKSLWNKNLMSRYFEASSAGVPLYPDANFSLRLAYGRVEGVQAADGLRYDISTTLDGIPPKYDSTRAEFDAPTRLLDLQREKDYGRYAVNGKVPVCFLASNHTTGGNSGSPVLNARGELIGLNFDRIWQGTMSDMYFDESICRNISVNIRYVLYILDKYGEAGWLLDEMRIVGRGF